MSALSAGESDEGSVDVSLHTDRTRQDTTQLPGKGRTEPPSISLQFQLVPDLIFRRSVNLPLTLNQDDFCHLPASTPPLETFHEEKKNNEDGQQVHSEQRGEYGIGHHCLTPTSGIQLDGKLGAEENRNRRMGEGLVGEGNERNSITDEWCSCQIS